jgi:hypothetical protein
LGVALIEKMFEKYQKSKKYMLWNWSESSPIICSSSS